MDKTHFVVVERMDHDDNDLPPYAVGPFTEVDGKVELESDVGIVFCLLTIDAKAENYVAHDCYLAEGLHDGALQIFPPDFKE